MSIIPHSTPGKLALVVAIAASLSTGLVAYSLWSEASAGVAAPSAGIARLRSMRFNDLTNSSITLQQWSGKTLVVNFWATWCPPCRDEMPAFSRLHEKYAARGLHFVGIGIDSPSAIKEYALQYPVSYPLLMGGSAGLDLMRELGNPNAALPFTLVLNRDGVAVFSRLGRMEEKPLEKLLLPLLEPSSSTADAGKTS